MIICVPVLFGACHESETMHKLDMADSLLDSHPDSALEIVRGINDSAIHTSHERARRSLLLTICLLKSGEIPENDSILLPAVEYYGETQTPSRETMLFHYASAAMSELVGNRAEAVSRYDLAYEMASGKDKELYKGLSRIHQSQIYGENYHEEEEMSHGREGVELLLKNGNPVYMKEALYHMGIVYVHHSLHHQADSVLESALLISAGNDAFENLRIRRLLASNAEMMGEYERSVQIWEDILRLDSGALREEDLYSYVRSLAKTGQFDKVSGLIHNCLECPEDKDRKLNYFYTLKVLACEEGRISEALACSDSVLKYSDMCLLEEQKRDIFREERDLQADEAALEKEISHKRKVIIVLLVAVILLGGVVFTMVIIRVIRFLREKNRRLVAIKDSEIESILKKMDSYEKRIAELMGRLEENMTQRRELENKNRKIEEELHNIATIRKKESGKIDDMEKEISNLEKKRFGLRDEIDKLRAEASGLQCSLKENFKLAHEFVVDYCNRNCMKTNGSGIQESTIAGLLQHYTDSEGIKSLEKQIDLTMDNVIQKLRSIPELNEDDIKIAMLGLCGFEYKVISVITGIKPKTVSGKKTRLKEKILKSGSPDIELIRNHLGF